MRDGRRNLQFFEEKLRDIQMRRVNQGVGDMSLGGSADDAGGPPAPPPKDSSSNPPGDRGSYGSGSGQYSQTGGSADLMPPRHPYAPGPGGSGIPKPRPNFTKLGSLLLCNSLSVSYLLPTMLTNLRLNQI
jgi:classical protein kinase C